MRERALWATVAHMAIDEHAKLIAAAKAGKRAINDTAKGVRLVVGTPDEERARARRYFNSLDWRIVASCAGIDHTDPERIMQAIEDGYTRKSGRVLA